MILNIDNSNYEIDKMSPLAIDSETLKWEPITIRLKTNLTASDFKKVKILIIKGYSEYKDAEIVVDNEIMVSENTITIQDVSYCSILN